MPRIAVAPDCQLHYELHGSGPTVLFLGATAYPGAIWERSTRSRRCRAT